MNNPDMFVTFKQWMADNPRQWQKREESDLTLPPDFKYTFGREVIPIYMRFLVEFGALNLLADLDEEPDTSYTCQLLTPWEIQDDFNEQIVTWNSPEFNLDFSYLMPFCRHTWTGYTYCFNMSSSGEDDLPVVMFDPTGGIPDADWETTDSFSDWLAKIINLEIP